MSEASSPIMFIHAQPPKRPHRKSRLGCTICKARKVKCDEVRPVCGNCYKRFPNAEEECEFHHASPIRRRSPSSTKESTPDSPTPSIGFAPSTRFSTLRSTELRLFHHFSTVTCLVMPACEESAGLNLWKATVPSLAFEFSSIYSAILGIAALHLLTLKPSDIALKATCYQYIGETVSAHREDMSITGSSNSLNQLLTSILITMHAKARTRYEANTGVQYTPPTNYFTLQNGASDLWNSTSEWGSEIRAFVECYSHLAPYREPVKPPEFHHNTYINQEFPYDPLPSFVEFDTSIIPERKIIYSHALAYVLLIKECIMSGENPQWIRHRLDIVPSVLGKDFYVLLQETDTLSLMILARLFALSKFVDEPWWLQGTAEYEVRGLETLVPDDWKWGMEWPLEVLETSLLQVVE